MPQEVFAISNKNKNEYEIGWNRPDMNTIMSPLPAYIFSDLNMNEQVILSLIRKYGGKFIYNRIKIPTSYTMNSFYMDSYVSSYSIIFDNYNAAISFCTEANAITMLYELKP